MQLASQRILKRWYNIFLFASSVMYHRIFVDQLGFLVTIIQGDDSLNKIFSLKEQDVRFLFFFHRIIFNGSSRYSGVTSLNAMTKDKKG
jgi:hypothetical protein